MLRSAWELGNMDVAMEAKDMFTTWMKGNSESYVMYTTSITFVLIYTSIISCI